MLNRNTRAMESMSERRLEMSMREIMPKEKRMDQESCSSELASKRARSSRGLSKEENQRSARERSLSLTAISMKVSVIKDLLMVLES